MLGALSALVFHLLASISPEASASIVAMVKGHPGMGDELVAICRRESRCSAVKVHERDAKFSDRVYRKASAVGWLDPRCQADRPGQWSTRGAFGLMAAYNLRWLPGRCLPPEVLDVPLVSAWAASEKLEAYCGRRRRREVVHPSLASWAPPRPCRW